MIKQYVLLVHGMGDHESGDWQGAFIKSFVSALKNYSPFKDISESDIKTEYFCFVPISYDKIFNGYRERWQENAGGVLEQICDLNADVGKIFDWLGKEKQSDSKAEAFFWTHLLDPLLWYCFKEARCAVVVEVIAQIVKSLQKMYAEERTNTAHIIAHSLGSSVVHDALVALRYYSDDEGLFKPSSHQWNTIAMVANVSRLLETRFTIDPNCHREAFKAYRSVLNPGAEGTVCTNYLNFHHKADPFTWPRRFHPANWPVHAYSDIESCRYQKLKEVHSFEHYMANPRVHLPLLRLISGRMVLGDEAEQRRVWNNYIQKYDKCAASEFLNLRALFNNNPDQKLDVGQMINFFYQAYQEVMHATD